LKDALIYSQANSFCHQFPVGIALNPYAFYLKQI
jgi:hypothetical protein